MVLTVNRSLFSTYPNISGIEEAASFLQALRFALVRKLQDAPPGMYLSVLSTRKLLQDNPIYHAALARCHAVEDVSGLEETPLLSPSPPKLEWGKSCYLSATRTYLERLHASLATKSSTSSWVPRGNGTVKYSDHIQSLNIPNLERADEPVLLLHDLGSFNKNPRLTERLASVFQSDTNIFLVNVSASGKTKLLLEGLRQNWGFYFTAELDTSTLGSRDLKRTGSMLYSSSFFSNYLPSKEDSAFPIRLGQNALFIDRYFSQILLARLLLFRSFLEVTSGSSDDDERRSRWLFMQLQPFTLPSSRDDPITDLLDMMRTWAVPNDFFAQAIRETLDSIFTFLTPSGAPLYIVIDEANAISGAGKYSFTYAFDDHPILNEILMVWHRHLREHNFIFIVAGTEIPQRHFQSDEWRKYRWCSGTGDFSDAELQRQYVSRFLPPAMLSSPSGEAFQLRLWKWFRHRHRFTAAIVSILLTHSFQSPHRLLDHVISVVTGYWPHDGEVYSNAEEKSKITCLFDRILMPDPPHYPSVRAAAYDALIHCLVTLDHRLIFGIDRVDVVSRALGRFIDGNMEQIAIDEPLCLVSCAQWFADEKKSLTDIDYYLSMDRKYLRPLSATCFVALCLAHVFSEPRTLADVFSFPGTLPKWANQTANLVDFTSTDLEKETGVLHYTLGISRRLACVADTQADTLSWLKDDHRTAFCIHSANSASPTLLFSLKLADESLVWLFLHVNLDGKAEEPVAKAELQDILTALKPENLFNERTNEETSTPETQTEDQGTPSPVETPSTAQPESSGPSKASEVSDNIRQLLESLPNRNQSVGACSVLRVVASLRALAKLDRLDVDGDHPIAELNTRFVQSITEKVSPTDILEDVVANATHIEGSTAMKRKSEDDGPTLKRQRSASLFNDSV